MSKHILSIDDHIDTLSIIQLALELTNGWAVSTASSGHEGVIKAVTEQPDAILTDVRMPYMDGVAVFQALQANALTQQIPVIFLTFENYLTIQKQASQLGVRGVIAKPFDVPTLANQIIEILGWSFH